MKLGFNIVAWRAEAPGLSQISQWQEWANEFTPVDTRAALAKCTHLPMMTARRLGSGSRLAVDCGLALLQSHPVDAVIFTSRHGELERNYRMLSALARQETPSPTDFTMSVHNSAVGSLTIAAKQPLVSSSLSAGEESFQQGLIEAHSLLTSGYQNVLLVDFEGDIPEFYHPHLPKNTPIYPYAVALVLSLGTGCEAESSIATEPMASVLPQGLQFLQGWLSPRPYFTVAGDRLNWQWSR